MADGRGVFSRGWQVRPEPARATTRRVPASSVRMQALLPSLLLCFAGCSGDVEGNPSVAPANPGVVGLPAGIGGAPGAPLPELPLPIGAGGATPGAALTPQAPIAPAPGAPPSVPAGELGPECAVPTASQTQIRRISSVEYTNAVRTLLGVQIEPGSLAPDVLTGAFAANRGDGASSLAATRYQSTAEEVSVQVLTRMDDLLGGEVNSANAISFIQRFARLAYRRAISAQEQQDFQAAFEADEARSGVAYGVQRSIEHVLQSPFFLYQVERSEPGNAPTGLQQLTGYSVAEKLASFVWESIPDEELLLAAENGSLSTPAGVRTQAERMLADGQSVEAIVSFFNQWLETDAVKEIKKDATQFPDFSEEIAQAMARESEDFVRWMLSAGRFTYPELMTSSQGFPGEDLADFYGVPAADPGDPVALPPEVRYGVLTHPSLMASHAHTKRTAIVLRGAFIRERLLCQTLPNPPADVDIELPEPPDGVVLTAREQIVLHREDPACAGCHALIDDLGFAFEHFDAAGQYRTEDNGLAVDSNGSVLGISTAGDFDSAKGLIDRIITSTEGVDCAVTQWHRFAQRRLEQTGDACSIQASAKAFVDSGYDFRSLILATVQSDSFRLRDTTPTALETP